MHSTRSPSLVIDAMQGSQDLIPPFWHQSCITWNSRYYYVLSSFHSLFFSVSLIQAPGSEGERSRGKESRGIYPAYTLKPARASPILHSSTQSANRVSLKSGRIIACNVCTWVVQNQISLAPVPKGSSPILISSMVPNTLDMRETAIGELLVPVVRNKTAVYQVKLLSAKVPRIVISGSVSSGMAFGHPLASVSLYLFVDCGNFVEKDDAP